ncbi:MAG: hypothetical protein M1490_00385 [Candidatus Bathyarchaeota archaeon]|nr:hypothetical protein [Candidatus Bathyarchaeota archaeon]
MERRKNERKEGYVESYAAVSDNALQDYEDAAYRTLSAKYRCRDCGKVFDTLEAQDVHWRKIHGQAEAVPLVGMPM